MKKRKRKKRRKKRLPKSSSSRSARTWYSRQSSTSPLPSSPCSVSTCPVDTCSYVSHGGVLEDFFGVWGAQGVQEMRFPGRWRHGPVSVYSAMLGLWYMFCVCAARSGITRRPLGDAATERCLLLGIAICTPPYRKTHRTQRRKPHHGKCTPPPHRCPAQRRASNSPPAQLVPFRNHPQLALTKKTHLAQVSDTPRVALTHETVQARVQYAPQLAQEINPLVRMRSTPHLAPAIRTQLAFFSFYLYFFQIFLIAGVSIRV